MGKVCDKCESRCVICDSFVKLARKVRICDECAFGKGAESCLICSRPAVADAYVCKPCVLRERDREGCPSILNVGSTKTDAFYTRKRNA